MYRSYSTSSQLLTACEQNGSKPFVNDLCLMKVSINGYSIMMILCLQTTLWSVSVHTEPKLILDVKDIQQPADGLLGLHDSPLLTQQIGHQFY